MGRSSDLVHRRAFLRFPLGAAENCSEDEWNGRGELKDRRPDRENVQKRHFAERGVLIWLRVSVSLRFGATLQYCIGEDGGVNRGIFHVCNFGIE